MRVYLSFSLLVDIKMAAPESTMRYSVLSDAAIFTCFFMTPDGSISYIHLIYSSMASATTLE